MKNILWDLPAQWARVELIEPTIEIVSRIEVEMELLPDGTFRLLCEKLLVYQRPDLIPFYHTKSVCSTPFSYV